MKYTEIIASLRRYIALSAAALPAISPIACNAQKSDAPSAAQNEASANRDPVRACALATPAAGSVYEIWDDDAELTHRYAGGIDIEPGASDDAKYLERRSVTPWLAPEYITTEKADGDDLSWAGGKYLRWLAATAATFHFPFYPDDWPGDLCVEAELRPKVNPSGAVRFYAPDANGERSWSQPLTADFAPGWNAFRWRLPRNLLAADGMQLMRISFPGSYFEGDRRVSAKFARIGLRLCDQPHGRFEVGSFPKPLRLSHQRVLSQSADVYALSASHRIERFFVVPDGASLEFSVAPSAYLEYSAKLRIEISSDGAKPEIREIAVEPGSCWQNLSIGLSEFAQKGVRIAFVPQITPNGDGFSKPKNDNGQILLLPPKVILNAAAVRNPQPSHNSPALGMDLPEIRQNLHPNRIVVIAVDNLRADRLTAAAKRRAVPMLSKIYDEGLSGVMMASGLSLASTVASFLTGLPPDAHGVTSSGTHLRASLTTIADALRETNRPTFFFSTSSIADGAKGFAKGFGNVFALNKENTVSSKIALERVASNISASPDKSVFFVHLSELRLPYKAPADKLDLWGVPGYAGTVSPETMQNAVVKQNPDAYDSRQIEAWYDGELSLIDEAVGSFAQKLPSDSLLILFGTHGNSLGETHLGYEQTLSPWELLTPYVFWMPDCAWRNRQTIVARPETLSATLLDLSSATMPAHAQTVFDAQNPAPQADAEKASATSTRDFFYRIRREGADVLYTTGLDGAPAHIIDGAFPILKQALREQIE